ncbi:hypothetical protein sos41_40240 [Alphaproteobacteria bacterium SO-S41]|nr:hypothetical protein sos41_40240 [Alphaproteobacteria bacterium SO-S41]
MLKRLVFALVAALTALPAWAIDANGIETYTVKTYTGTASGAGTDSNITLRIDGVDHEGVAYSVTKVLNPLIANNAFENGQTDTALFDDVGLAHITTITITTDDAGAGSGWNLEWIEISTPSLCGGGIGNCTWGTPERFAVGGWLDSDRTSVTIAASSIAPLTNFDQQQKDAEDSEAAEHERKVRYCQEDIGLGAKRLMTPDRLAVFCDMVIGSNVDPRRAEFCLLSLARYNIPLTDENFVMCATQPDGDAARAMFESARAARASTPPTAPPATGSSEEERCRAAVANGEVAWNSAGDTRWEPGNIELLCAGVTDAEARIGCFRNGVAAGKQWTDAIDDCEASGDRIVEAPSPPEPQPVPAPPVASPDPLADDTGAEEQRCRALLQDQVPWQLQPPERHWSDAALDALCKGSTNGAATVQCFQDVLWNNDQGSDIFTAVDACRAN